MSPGKKCMQWIDSLFVYLLMYLFINDHFNHFNYYYHNPILMWFCVAPPFGYPEVKPRRTKCPRGRIQNQCINGFARSFWRWEVAMDSPRASGGGKSILIYYLIWLFVIHPFVIHCTPESFVGIYCSSFSFLVFSCMQDPFHLMRNPSVITTPPPL